jgi:single-strand DNA-binding protein
MHMDANNVVLLRGTLTSDPVVRSLPSGGSVTQLELTMRVADRATSVPVAVHGESIGFVAGDAVVVTGHVSRRFFRAGGVTQSRTEVVAAEVIRATRRRTIERAVEGVVDLLTGSPGDRLSREA